MTRVDWIALAIAALAALSGLRRGLIATALSFAGLAAGAIVGARAAPHFLSGGSLSPYTPLAGLVGALVGAAVLRWVATLAGSFARGGMSVIPPLRMLDSLGGLIAGAALGFGLVWVAGAVLLQLPGQTSLRQEVQNSVVLQRLNEIAPPRTVLRALSRVDPFPQISGPAPPAAPPDKRVLSSALVRRARPSVVRITATACGLGVEGSGWVARAHIVVTAAHVVAGARGIRVNGHAASARVVDRREDVAILRVATLKAPALPITDARAGDSVAILGYPENGPFNARPGRVGNTADVLSHGVLREVTALSGLVRHGNSGGPAVNESGEVEATVFAARIGARAGYGIPAAPVRAALARAKRPVSTGSC
ncbi:MAG: MarP family serine protease [Actinobacteria bacterium]|nr:MarP family serine protease [Actinomycetota bacterium]